MRRVVNKNHREGVEERTSAYLYGHLATVAEAEGDLRTARVYIERALSINEKALGPEHPDVASNRETLARILRESDTD